MRRPGLLAAGGAALFPAAHDGPAHLHHSLPAGQPAPSATPEPPTHWPNCPSRPRASGPGGRQVRGKNRRDGSRRANQEIPHPPCDCKQETQPCIHRWACEQRESTQNISKTSCTVNKRGCFSQNAENDQISKSTFFIKQEKVFKTIVLFFIKGYKM